MKPALLLLAAFFMLAKSAPAETLFVKNVQSVTQADGRVDIQLDGALLRLEVRDVNVIRFRYGCGDFAKAPSYAVVDGQGGNTRFTLTECKERVEVSTDELTVRIDRKTGGVSILDRSGNLVNEDAKHFGAAFTGNEVRCYKRLLDGEQFFGLGEKTGFLDRRGGQYTMWNSDFPFYEKKEDPLYVSIPFYIGLRENRAYGIFFDNTYRSRFNFGAGTDRFTWFGAEGGELDYYFIYGPSMKRVVSSYTSLTGKMELPPMWALGFQQSRWSYYPESKVRRIAQTFREKKIPCDVIYLDIDYMDGYRVFTWDRTRFPEPEKMLGDLAKAGFKVIPIIDPGVKADGGYAVAKEGLAQGLFAKYPDGEPYRGEVWPSWAYFPDFTREKTRKWWGGKLGGLLRQGVQGFWNDMNEPAVWGGTMPDLVLFDDNGFGADHRKIHNVYALAMARATADALREHSQRRHFILTRAGFAGVQRYAAVWTGDNVASNDHLELACLMPQSMGLSGLAFAGSDVGGFGGCPSGNLYTRWMQLGAFTPFFRAHSATGEPDKEPWALGDDVERRCREAISLRYRLLPFLYTEFRRAAETGLPLMRPMVLEFQDDGECQRREAQLQFMVGGSLLVAPVLNEHDTFKKAYLPEGRWLGWWDGAVYEGKRWHVVEAPIARIPLFIREGGIVPMQEAQQWVGEKAIRQLELRIFPSAGSSYELYEDDGVTFGYRNGAYSLTKIDVERSGGSGITVRFSKIRDGFDAGRASVLLHVHDVAGALQVAADGRLLASYPSQDSLGRVEEGFALDETSRTLHVKVKAGTAAVSIGQAP